MTKATRRLSWAIASVVVIGLIGVASVWLFNQDDESADKPRRSVRLGSAQIIKGDLSETLQIEGKLSYGDPIGIETLKGTAEPASDTPDPSSGPSEVAGASSGSGGADAPGSAGEDGKPPAVVTWLPEVGAAIHKGEPLFRINSEPVVLFYGDLPLWRDLTVGVKGEDVTQLERNLSDVGYGGITVDNQFTAQTASAVKKWQKKLAIPETGVVKVSDVVFQPDEVRIAELKAKRGGRASGEIVSVTSTKPTVVMDLDVNNRDMVAVGSPVMVQLPDGQEIPGKVTNISNSAQQSEEDMYNGEDAVTVPVTVSLDDPSKASEYEQTPVSVRLVVEEQQEVLIAPVTALLARHDGGFSVAVLEKGKRRVVKVETGMYVGGQVEITGDGIKEGTTIEVPKT